MKLYKITESIQKNMVIALSEGLKTSDEIIRLKELYPNLDKIIMVKNWSGFNDGDAEYAICRPAWNHDMYLYRNTDDEFEKYDNEHDDHDEYYFLNGSGEYDDVEFKVKPSEDEFDAIHVMTEDERNTYIKLYDQVCSAVFDMIEGQYKVGDTIVIDV